jgi:heavy metal translocating P-type ATPase
MKRIWRFLKEYKLFSLAVVAVIAAGIFQLSGLGEVARWILGVVAIIETLPLLKGMWEDLRTGTYGIDILAITAIVTAVILNEGWAAMVVVLMLTGGESLEDYAEHRSKSELDALLSRAPQLAHLVKSRGTVVDVKVSEVHTGNKLIIRPGEVVPVDATIIEGSASFDESSLTGESIPQAKDKGDQILSGSINLDGSITVTALHSAADSQYEQIVKLVRAAANSQAPFVRLADRYAIPFTIVSFIIAGTVWAVSGHAIRFLEVIIVATPCPLILAAPIAIISGMSRSAKAGIIIKTGSALERFAQAKTFAFDKTGTLTVGTPKVAAITAYGSFKDTDVLQAAATLEQNSNHVLARAILEAAQAAGVRLAKGKHIKEVSGQGLSAQYSGKHVLVGRLSFIQNEGAALPKNFDPKKIQQTATYVAIDGELAGVITFADELRPESKPTLQKLKQLGVKHILMVTGDSTATAQKIAGQLGITEVKAEALPADKLIAIEKLPHRPVAFIGDGVNDAPVLTASDVGIALGARGSTAASESADIVVLQDSLAQVSQGLEIAKHSFKIARQSILVGIALSFVLMIVFATGKFPPIYGAALQEVVDVVVIFNALRALSFKPSAA